jgi:hypothetical protein
MGKFWTHLLSFSLGAALIVAFGFYSWLDLRYVFSPTLHFANASSYKGPVDKQGQMSGYGRLTWTNGDRYEGNFFEGLFEGTGHLSIMSSAEYDGQFHRGYMVYANGEIYEGEFVRGVFQGQGKLVVSSGAVYEGDFQKGEMTGKGKWTYVDKSTYSGDVKNGFAHGKGEWTYVNGNKYTGEYRDGKKQGQGVFATELGVYTGEFAEDQFTGKGSYKSKDGSLYEGNFVNWELDGEGVKTDKHGNRWQGIFRYGELDGEGVYSGKDGEHYEGNFKFGSYSGKGKLREANGDVYEGEFRHGYKDGRGVLSFKELTDGVKQVKGRWDNNRLVEGDETTKIYSPAEVVDFAIYKQQATLAKQLEAIRLSNPDKAELYSLVVAAYGTQEVFHRESVFIEDLFARQYENQSTAIYLNNSQRSLGPHPLATLGSIRESIARLAQQMDKDKDVLFIYITSHGSKEKKISLTHNGLDFGTIDSDWLAREVKATGVKHRVVVLSACYSGGFIDELKDENTIVITSAAADRTSFGCGDDSHFTYFAKAFFKESFTSTNDYVDSFYRAQKLIQQWENNEKQKPSNPQIYVAAPVAEYLKQIDLKKTPTP